MTLATITRFGLLSLALCFFGGRAALGGEAEPLGPRIGAVLARATPGVVILRYGEGQHCTGAIITPDGLVLTCAHISRQAGDPIEVRLVDGRKAAGKVLAKLARDGELVRDVALVQIVEGGPWPFLEVGTAADLTPRDPLISFGFGWSGLYSKFDEEPPLQVHLGTRLANTRRPADLVPTMIDLVGGDSGGPLVDMGGRVVGVAAGTGDLDCRSRFTTVDVLRREWRTLAGDRRPPALPTGRRPTPATAVEELASALDGLRDSVVEVRSDERWVGAGAVVGRGWVLTKASELGPNLTVLLRNEKTARARLAATDPTLDLALLRLPGADMTDGIRPVDWGRAEEPAVGTPLACVTPAAFTPPTGIVSTEARAIPPISGGLALFVANAAGGVEVTEVITDLNEMLRPPPQEFRVGDVITELNGKPVRDREAYFDRCIGMASESPPLVTGDMVLVKFRRAGIDREVTTRLRPGYTVSDQWMTPHSYRYSGFPRALICDFSARPELCGSPVADARGRVVGLLIAKAPFVESLVIPSGAIQQSLDKMMAQARPGKKP